METKIFVFNLNNGAATVAEVEVQSVSDDSKKDYNWIFNNRTIKFINPLVIMIVPDNMGRAQLNFQPLNIFSDKDFCIVNVDSISSVYEINSEMLSNYKNALTEIRARKSGIVTSNRNNGNVVGLDKFPRKINR